MLLLSRMLRWHRPWMAWCLVASLLLSPLVGHMHGVTHAGLHAAQPHSAAAPASATPSLQAPHAHAAHHHSALLAHVFADHDLLDCLTLDQLCLGDSPPPPSTVPTAPKTAAWKAPTPATHALPLRTAHAWARGPPLRSPQS